MDHLSNRATTKESLIIGFLLLLIISSVSYIGFDFYSLYKKNISLENTVSDFEHGLSVSQKNLTKLRSDYLATLETLRTEQQNNAYFEEKINTISSTVGLLEKLSKTDSELLKKYSKVYFLNENYIPPKLTIIASNYLYTKDKPLEFHSDAYPFLEKLLNAATESGIPLQVISAYRSFGTQAYLKSSYKVTYGIGTANKFSADQGYSEHQLGTTVDFTTPKTGANFVGFDKTDSYKWLVENAYKYGFILSYPKQNSFYSFEPWHWRFVGVKLATQLHEENNFFYSMDQREIDQNLVNLFD